MVDIKILQRAALVGSVLQVAMVLIGHFVAWVAENVYLFGGMFIAGLAGLLYAQDYARGYPAGALGGAIVGPTSTAAGIAMAIALHDARAELVPIALVTGIFLGAIGGLFGQMGANMRAAINSRR